MLRIERLTNKDEIHLALCNHVKCLSELAAWMVYMSLVLLSDRELQDLVNKKVAGTPGFRNVKTRRDAIAVIKEVLPLLSVRGAALCGSFARNEQTEASDIDLFVAFQPASRIGDVEVAREALEYATGRKVDIITSLNKQTKSFRDSIIKDGIKIYG